MITEPCGTPAPGRGWRAETASHANPSADAHDGGAGITVEVGPGGGLRSITLADRALRLGSTGLAGAILDLVRMATEQANQRARLAVPQAVAGLSQDEVATLGIGEDPRLVEQLESTTPESWMR